MNSSIAPGAAVGTSDLQVTAVPGAPYDVALAADNGGNRYTGRDRVTAAATVNDPLGHGDVLSVTGLTAGANLDYGRLAYQSLLANGAGTSVGGSVSGLYYHLANGLSQLHAHGTAQTESVTVMQPLIRSVKGNLFAQVGFESRQLRDEVDVTDIHTDRRTYALTATLAGDRRDASGISNINAALTAGQLDFQNGTAKAADSSTAKTRGGYAKLNVSLARLQGLTQSNSLYVAFNGQIADKNLDPSEQFLSADRLASGPTTWVPSAGLWVRWRLWNCVTTSALLCPGCGRRLRSWTVAWFEFTKISSKQERTLRLFRAPAWA